MVHPVIHMENIKKEMKITNLALEVNFEVPGRIRVEVFVHVMVEAQI